MKKMRAIFAVLIAAAAIMGMTASAEAAKSTHILVDELDYYLCAAAECDWRYSRYVLDDAILVDNAQDSMYLTKRTADSFWYLDAEQRRRRLSLQANPNTPN